MLDSFLLATYHLLGLPQFQVELPADESRPARAESSQSRPQTTCRSIAEIEVFFASALTDLFEQCEHPSVPGRLFRALSLSF